MRAVRLGLLGPLLLLGTAAPDPAFERRIGTFVAGGYDPLTAPVDWYAPRETVTGAPMAIGKAVPSAAISPAALEDAASWAEAQGSTALLVTHRGTLIFERYWHGDGRDTRFNPQSMSKTLTALLVGIAIDRGEISSADDPVGRYVEEWRGDPRGHITLRQLLHMASGLAQIGAGHGYAITAANPAARQHFGSDFVGPMLGLALAGKPGATFDYNNNDNLLLGLVLERAAKTRYSVLLSERLFTPLGLGDASLYMDRVGGFPMTSCCVFSRPIDWLAIGRLIAQNGVARGRRIVSPSWIAEMTTPSPAYKGYGYQIWIGDQTIGGTAPAVPGLVPWSSERFAAPTVFLHGHGSQRTWIIPSADLVIVRAGKTWPKGWDEAAIPNRVLRGRTTR